MPPSCNEVRRLIGIMTLAIGIPRLPVIDEVVSFAPQRFGPSEAFGIISVLLGIALLATAFERRLTVPGRAVAGLSFVWWVTLAAATTSATSLMLDLAVSASLLVEVGTLRRCCNA